MGINCPDVQHIIYLGPPDGIEEYIQETGRAGRNGSLSYATLLITKGWKRFVDDNMTKYIENDSQCRRKLLFNDVEDRLTHPITPCLCCDICKKNCVVKDVLK